MMEVGTDLTADELAVLMQMDDEYAHRAENLSADLNDEQPEAGWTPKKVAAIRKSLHAKGYADFGPLYSEDDNILRGRGYWLSTKGADIRYPRVSETCMKPRPAILVRHHDDGPYVLHNGSIRWLSWGERVALIFGRLPVEVRNQVPA